MMEKSIGNCAQVELDEGETLQWWKWITTLLVLLSYSTLVVRWIPVKFHGVIPAARPFVLDDQALLSALNLSTSLGTISTTCENFLLTEESNDEVTESEKVPIQGWSDGEWHHPPESSALNFLQQPRTMGGSVGHYGASFSVNPFATHGTNYSPEWSSCSQKTPVHAIEGHLELKNLWNWNPSMEAVMFAEASGAKVDFNQMLAMQNLKVVLKGAYVDTNAGRRVCMTGCAYRNDHSYQIDCGFNLKMKYPTRQPTSLPQKIEAELMSSTRTITRAGDDPYLQFPAAIRIHKDIVDTEYTAKVTYLRSALNLPNKIDFVNNNAHLRRRPHTAPREINLEDYDDDTYSGYH